MEITNKINTKRRIIYSNLVYPSLLEWRRVCKIDKDWFNEKLIIKFNVQKLLNKYACAIDGKCYYNHDGTIYLIERI